MASPRVLSEQRRSARAPLNLPLHIRWQGPLGQSVETAETLDVSRTGLLFYRTQPMPVCARLWVVYPYAKENATSLPETPARVVRVKTTPGGGQLVAVEFQPLRSGNVPLEVANRRRGQRTPVALAMSIRIPGVPWGEEAMTLDVSDGGMRFTTPHQYRVGETVRVTLAGGRWAAAQGELPARVVRVELVPGSVEHHVALRLEHPSLQ